jgi:hypothetical protein
MAHRVHKNLLGHLYLLFPSIFISLLTRRGKERAGWENNWDGKSSGDMKILCKALLIENGNKSPETSSLVISLVLFSRDANIFMKIIFDGPNKNIFRCFLYISGY